MKNRTNEDLEAEIVELEKLTKANQDLKEERVKLLWSLTVKRLQLLVQLPPARNSPRIAYSYGWLHKSIYLDKRYTINLAVNSGNGLYLTKRHGHDYLPEQRLWSINKPNEFTVPEGLTREEFLEWILELKIAEAVAWVEKKNQALRVEIEELAQREI